MSNKILTNEERRQRLKVELEKTKVRVLKANEKCVAVRIKLDKSEIELEEVNKLKSNLEYNVNACALLIAELIISFSSLLLGVPAFVFMVILGSNNIFTFLYIMLSVTTMFFIILKREGLESKISSIFQKIMNKKLKKSKNYQDLLEKINVSELKFKYNNIEYGKAMANYYEALGAKSSLEHKIFNFYDNHYNYKYVNDRKTSYSKSKPLSSKKDKKKIKKLEKN